MLLSRILKNVDYSCENFSDAEIADIVYDSRRAQENTLFVALPGAFTDGHDYAGSAYLKGARVFLVERKVSLPEDAVQIAVGDTRSALAVISAEFFSHPEKELDIIGVTGTKGKTTVTHMLRSVLDSTGLKSGVIGTVGAYYGDEYIPTVNTTPESYETMKILRQMSDAGVRAVCMEVSSLGLKAHRVDGLEFAFGIITNFSPDHIGGAEHESVEEYAFWKKQLFKQSKRAVVCADDEFCRSLLPELTIPFTTYGIAEKADFTARGIKKIREKGLFGVGFDFCCGNETVPMKIPMPGEYNVLNALACVSVAKHYCSDTALIADALSGAVVRGRNDCVKTPFPFDVIIDYAHNGASFEGVLDAFSEYEHNRIITVFGSVGDRAMLRRSEMGLISGRRADLSVITTDDPGNEDPLKIAEEIASFVASAGGKYIIETDRFTAVKKAFEEARPGDIVLILGKGHETAQKICGRKIHYSDYETVQTLCGDKEI